MRATHSLYIMYRSRTVLALVPARGGSKRIPKKNIKKLKGKPLISYAIRALKKAKSVDRIVVSTDDEGIARVARRLGAEILMRPQSLAKDTVPMAPVIAHAVRSLKKNKSWMP